MTAALLWDVIVKAAQLRTGRNHRFFIAFIFIFNIICYWFRNVFIKILLEVEIITSVAP